MACWIRQRLPYQERLPRPGEVACKRQKGNGWRAAGKTERFNRGKNDMSYKEVSGGICAPRGFAAAGVHCGIRANHNEKYDLALIKAEVRCAVCAAVPAVPSLCGRKEMFFHG